MSNAQQSNLYGLYSNSGMDVIRQTALNEAIRFSSLERDVDRLLVAAAKIEAYLRGTAPKPKAAKKKSRK